MSATAVSSTSGAGAARRRLGLVAAALSVAIPGLAYSGLFMSEALVYPLSTLALAAMAAALARPRRCVSARARGDAALALLTHVRAAALDPGPLPGGRDPVRVRTQARAGAPPGAAVGCGRTLRRGDRRRLRARRPLERRLRRYAAAAGGYELRAVAGRRLAPGRHLRRGGRDPARRAGDDGRRVRRGGSATRGLRARRDRAAWTIALVLEVGTFASRWVEHVAERELLTVAPPLFLVFGLWLARGAAARPWTKLARSRGRDARRPPAGGAIRRPGGRARRVQLHPALAARRGDVDHDPRGALPARRPRHGRRGGLRPPAGQGRPAGARRDRARRPLGRLDTRDRPLSRLDRAWVFDTGDPRWLDAAADGPVAYLHGRRSRRRPLEARVLEPPHRPSPSWTAPRRSLRSSR